MVLASLTLGIAGVLWQARVANVERRKAEARASDLRELSNSLLSELDEAIKELPGSTGVQRLLVTRVLEHLDRASKDATGDRLTQLDLVNAFTRLGNIQGNPYDQNLGDRAGALASLDKALAVASSLTSTFPGDQDVLRASASVLQARSEVLWGIPKTAEAVASMQAAVQIFDKLASAHDATPALICDAATAYGALGDELGQPGTPSLGDLSGAVGAYKRVIHLYEQALSINPDYARARRGLAISSLKAGNIDIETDPAEALKDFELAEKRFEALPESKQDSLSSLRMRANLLRKKAMAMRELAEYRQAAPFFGQALAIQKKVAAADSKDSRSLFDVYVDVSQMAYDYEDAADPALEKDPSVRRRNLTLAVPLLQQAQSIMLQLLKVDPSNDDWKSALADVQVRLGTALQQLGTSGNSAALSATALSTLKMLGAKHPESVLILDAEVAGLLTAQPARLREPALAVACAEREAMLTKRKEPDVLQSLASAYRSAGQIERSITIAKEGLALLPPRSERNPASRIRRLLELETAAEMSANSK